MNEQNSIPTTTYLLSIEISNIDIGFPTCIRYAFLTYSALSL